MIEIENNLYNRGYKYVACIDEVGRGCLAGDVIACAIIMPIDDPVSGVKDSKKLTPKRRKELNDEILKRAVAVGYGHASPNIIDTINIKEATRLAMKEAVLKLKDKDGKCIEPDYILIDAEEVAVEIPQTSIIKGDEKVYGISCASIVAKVYRDNLCEKWADIYKGYKIEKNKGYGTKEHIEAIRELGPTSIHRKTFLKNILKDK